MFLRMLTVVPAVFAMPVTGKAAVLERLKMLFWVMFASAAALVMPTTVLPVEEIGSTVFCETVRGAPVVALDEPKVMPVMTPAELTLLTVFVLTFVPGPLKFTDIPVIALVPPVMLLNVLFVIVFVGPLVEDAPSVLLHPASVVAPVTVTFEKLFRLLVIVEPVTDEAFAPKKVIVPPAPPLLNAVTIELPLQFSTPVAVMLLDRVMNVTLPVVLTFRFVNVLLLMLAVLELALVLLMKT